VRSFKRFEAEVFDLRDDIVVAGPNNAGKSTLPQAIAVWGWHFRGGARSQERERRKLGSARVSQSHAAISRQFLFGE
jgi:predicted ATPase